jgi:hypothetical protein
MIDDDDITNQIKRSAVTNIIKDDKEFPLTQINYLGRTVNCEALWPYGFGGVAPVGSLNVTFNVQGQEENQFSISTLPDKRIKNLKEGETYFANLLTGTVQINKANGDLDILVANDKKVTIKKDLTITVSGNAVLDVTGNVDLKAGGSVVIDSDSIDLGVGGVGIARLGDEVTVDGQTGTITQASSKNRST